MDPNTSIQGNDDIDPLASVKAELTHDSEDSSDNYSTPFCNQSQSSLLCTRQEEISVGGGGKHHHLIQLGQTFHSISEVFQIVRRYEILNRTRLLHKYFRKIAANPKPSNKEDYMLTKEERIRFLYRWIDFCCTHYDDVQKQQDRGKQLSPDPNFTVKECPMRIRFQLRTPEKDLTVSLFRGKHDHELPNCRNIPKREGINVLKGVRNHSEGFSVRATNVIHQQPGPPPPLARINNNRKIPKNESGPSSSITSHCLSRPPPLKKGILNAATEASNSSLLPNGHGSTDGLSVDSIIKNIYSYLCTKHSQGSTRDGIMFITPNPNLVKLVADMTGLTQSRVSQTVQHCSDSDQPRAFTSTRFSSTAGDSNNPTRGQNHQWHTTVRVSSSLSSFSKKRIQKGIGRSIKRPQKICDGARKPNRYRYVVEQRESDSDSQETHTLLYPHVVIKTESHYENDSANE